VIYEKNPPLGPNERKLLAKDRRKGKEWVVNPQNSVVTGVSWSGGRQLKRGGLDAGARNTSQSRGGNNREGGLVVSLS